MDRLWMDGRRMDGWMKGWMDHGWMNEWRMMYGWLDDGWMDGWMGVMQDRGSSQDKGK